ncbi:MAG: hypothetical protein CO075_03305, partial [Candidatus Moranbacteria bacterium CG_4_9_14_0_8_um_filter_41_43]
VSSFTTSASFGTSFSITVYSHRINILHTKSIFSLLHYSITKKRGRKVSFLPLFLPTCSNT